MAVSGQRQVPAWAVVAPLPSASAHGEMAFGGKCRREGIRTRNAFGLGKTPEGDIVVFVPLISANGVGKLQ